MSKIAFFCVNYNSYDSTIQYLKSIERSAMICKSDIDVFVCDNTVDNIKELEYCSSYIKVLFYKPKRNLGYFGGINYMMNQSNVSCYDFVILSNVDIELEEDVLEKLCSLSIDKNIGWIAPQIYSTCENRDRNPKILNRYNRKRILMFRFIFKYPILHYLYTKTLYLLKRKTHNAKEYIYGGHGSFIILTKEYFIKNSIVDYPVFLYGEEIYLAEMCKKSDLKVWYKPEIKIKDYDHVSTGKMKRSVYYKCNYEAMDYILKTYYEE